jgi:spoIIIJ-associated protein
MEWVETTGRTVEEAKDRALDQLGVDAEDAEFDVLEEPRPGLFGRLRGHARVRARVRPTQPRPKAQRTERRRSRDRRPSSPAVDADAADAVAGAGNGGLSGPPATPEAGAPAPDEAAADVAAAEAFLNGLVEAFGLTARTSAQPPDEDGEVEMTVEGEDLGLLIGPRGQTLAAVQDLTRMAVQRRNGDRHTRLRVDVAGYRQRRRVALGHFAERVAAEVLASGRAKVLEPMGAADRKVVHDTVNAIAGLDTVSEGDEPFRRVVIRPAGDG